MAVTDARQELHRIIDELPEEEVPIAQRFLWALKQSDEHGPIILEPAPFDDETEQEKAGVAEGLREVAEGKLITHEEVMRKHGLS